MRRADRRRGHQARRVCRSAIRIRALSGSGVGVSARARRGRHRRHRRRAGAPPERAVFLTWITRLRPYVIVKAAVSSDGFVGRSDDARQADGRRRGSLPSASARRSRGDRRRIRHGADRRPVAHRARRLPVSPADAHHLRLARRRFPPSARVFSTLDAGPVIMVVSAQAAAMNPVPLVSLERRGVLIDRREDRMLAPLLEWLGARGVVSLLVEGGPDASAGLRERGPRRSRAARS